MKCKPNIIGRTGYIAILLYVVIILCRQNGSAQGVIFKRDLSPAEGLVKPQEKPFRDEICLNGKWDFQPAAVPSGWVAGNGVPPELTHPVDGVWETTKIKIPSPWNVNEWGAGSKTGAGTNQPYAPSSVYYPSYPASWGGVRMGWLKRSFNVPAKWNGEREILHFEAVMGDFVMVINGKQAAHHFGDYMPFEVDITDFVKPNQNNELLVGIRHRRLFDKTDVKYEYFRSTYAPGSNTDNLVGIWQDVYLLAVPRVRITNVFVKPWVDKDLLEFDVQMINQTKKPQTVSLKGNIRQWVNEAGKEVGSAPEIKWRLGDKELIKVNRLLVTLQPGESREITLNTKVQGRLTCWSPDVPQLYTILLNVNHQKQVYDRKTTRFGWRQLTIKGKDFYLNGNKIQCFADIQHPFGAYICSRRFAWAWFKMIKDVGGNAVRLHAQPWPSTYLDLADEMGLMVLDEAALFGSSLSLNFGEAITWERTAEHIDNFVLRDRNHPSVIGWSAGNELFAISLYNKPAPEVAKVWEEKSVALARRPALLDPTRPFITDDGDEDMHGNLPVWSKHFSHGLTLERLPKDMDKPVIIGESGATYYGKPDQLFQFVGEKAYASYYGRNEALAVDVYQNIVKMAKPYLAYYSPSELSWFGIEQMNLGYHDYSRLPDEHDGIFAGKPYEEGKPGYQLERIPPYVTTFNPGLDPSLPVYKPLPMFEAMKAALAKGRTLPSPWDHYTPHVPEPKPKFPVPVFDSAYFVGSSGNALYRQLNNWGIKLTANEQAAKLIIIDGENVSADELQRSAAITDRVKKQGGMIWIMIADKHLSPALHDFLPASVDIASRKATSLESNSHTAIGKYFSLPDLYFAEVPGDNKILKQGLSGDLVKQGSIVFDALNTDWSLFNEVAENKKCAQIVLYEHLKKPQGVAMVNTTLNNAVLTLSTMDYQINSRKATDFWKNLFAAMGIRYDTPGINQEQNKHRKQHDLLLDGPPVN